MKPSWQVYFQSRRRGCYHNFPPLWLFLLFHVIDVCLMISIWCVQGLWKCNCLGYCRLLLNKWRLFQPQSRDLAFTLKWLGKSAGAAPSTWGTQSSPQVWHAGPCGPITSASVGNCDVCVFLHTLITPFFSKSDNHSLSSSFRAKESTAKKEYMRCGYALS